MAGSSKAGSVTPASAIYPTPSAYWLRNISATFSASRVLPTPPGPVRVNRRVSGRSRISEIAVPISSRPMKVVRGTGRSGRSSRAMVRRAMIRQLPPGSPADARIGGAPRAMTCRPSKVRSLLSMLSTDCLPGSLITESDSHYMGQPTLVRVSASLASAAGVRSGSTGGGFQRGHGKRQNFLNSHLRRVAMALRAMDEGEDELLPPR